MIIINLKSPESKKHLHRQYALTSNDANVDKKNKQTNEKAPVVKEGKAKKRRCSPL